MNAKASAHAHPPAPRSVPWLEWLDRGAMLLSILCAVHCVVTPLLLLVAPFVASHEFEEQMRLLLGGLAIVAVGAGTLTHRSWRAVPFLFAGLALLVGVQLFGNHGSSELLFSLVAAASLVTAHVINTLACRRHRAIA